MILDGPFAGLQQNGYGCILADPPWPFQGFTKASAPHRSEKAPYEVMSMDELRALPVAALAAKNCVLLMWVVDSHLDIAMELGRGWGFKFKTRAFTWRKLTAAGQAKIGMGFWTRKQTEICLLFTRGSPKRLSKGVREIIDAPKREHSRKPDEQYERIEQLVAGPYVELFARQHRPEWDAWGDETGKFDPPVCDAFDALLG